MSDQSTCPHCNQSFPLPATAAGKTVRCPGCKATFVVPMSLDEHPPPQPANPFAFKPAAKRDSRADDDDDDDRPERPRYRLGQGQAGGWKLAGGVIAVLVAVGVGVAVNRLMSKPDASAEIPESKWRTVEVPGVMKAMLPSEPNLVRNSVAGVPVVTRTSTPNEDSVYMIMCTEEPLPAERRALPVDTILDDACNGSVAAVKDKGAKELSRSSVSLGKHPGRQIVMSVPEGKGKLVYRIYVANGRLIIVMAGGKGMEPDNANAKKLFDSVQVLAPPIADIESGDPPPPRKRKTP
jgi:hypothetical protein